MIIQASILIARKRGTNEYVALATAPLAKDLSSQMQTMDPERYDLAAIIADPNTPFYHYPKIGQPEPVEPPVSSPKRVPMKFGQGRK